MYHLLCLFSRLHHCLCVSTLNCHVVKYDFVYIYPASSSKVILNFQIHHILELCGHCLLNVFFILSHSLLVRVTSVCVTLWNSGPLVRVCLPGQTAAETFCACLQKSFIIWPVGCWHSSLYGEVGRSMGPSSDCPVISPNQLYVVLPELHWL